MEMQVFGRVDNSEESEHQLELCKNHKEDPVPNRRKSKVCYQCVPAGLPKAQRIAENKLMEIDLYNGTKLVTKENARDIDVGFCFEHLGNAQLVNEGSAIIAACNYQEDRFKLPVIPCSVELAVIIVNESIAHKRKCHPQNADVSVACHVFATCVSSMRKTTTP